MKTLRLLFLATLTTMYLSSCTKEGPAGRTGPTGPAGPTGATGATGAVGPQGVSGNANVVLYEYGSKTFTSSVSYLLTNMSKGRIDSSIVLVYTNPSLGSATSWYPVPGGGVNGAYETRDYWYQSTVSPSAYTVAVRTLNFDGTLETTSKTFTKCRIYVVKASTLLPGTKKGEIDLNDQDAVYEYLIAQKE